VLLSLVVGEDEVDGVSIFFRKEENFVEGGGSAVKSVGRYGEVALSDNPKPETRQLSSSFLSKAVLFLYILS
jgi:hypothetical protein